MFKCCCYLSKTTFTSGYSCLCLWRLETKFEMLIESTWKVSNFEVCAAFCQAWKLRNRTRAIILPSVHPATWWHCWRELPSVNPFSSFPCIERVNHAVAVMATAAFDNWSCSHDHALQRQDQKTNCRKEQCVLMNFALFLSLGVVVSGSISF